MTNTNIKKGPMAWMAANSVPANLLMLILMVGGFLWGTQIKQEIFPEFDIDEVFILVSYPGASPGEIEQGIVLPIEEAIQAVDGIRKISSTVMEGRATVSVEAIVDADIQKLATDIKNEVDRITSFPEEAEEPLVTVPSSKNQVISLVVYGDQNRKVLREVTESIRDQLLQDKEITQTELLGVRPLELSIEISQETLNRYSLTLAQIADTIRRSSLDLPGGSIKTSGGEILLRVKEQKDYKEEYAQIPVITNPDGTLLTLGDIAVISDGFEDTDQQLIYNNQLAIQIDVYRVGKQTPITVSDAVYKHMDRLQKSLPDGVSVDTFNDRSKIFKQRMNLLLKNGFIGLVLIFLLLGLFLEVKLAFWVTMGIPISFLGSLLFIPQMGVSINMISLFAFIITLGIVVDDTIIIGENVYQYRQQGYTFLKASIQGAREVAMPVTFSVLTNIITFLPLYFVPGTLGKIFKTIPVVVVAVFFISLVEALFILPSHLAHQKKTSGGLLYAIGRVQQRFSNWFITFVKNVYGPSLQHSLRFRYVSLTIGIVILIITLAYVGSGRMGMAMFPSLESDLSYASATLPERVPFAETTRVHDRLMGTADQLIEEIGREQQVKGILSYIDKNTTWIQVYMVPPKERLVSTSDFTRKWRKTTGNVAGIENMEFSANFGGPGHGSALTVELQHRDTNILKQGSAELAKALNLYPIVSDIDDGFTLGKDQFDYTVNTKGYQLGLTPIELSRQIRNAYYGSKVGTQLRGRNEVKIMVKRSEHERKAEYYLDEMLITTPQGIKVPLSEVANVKKGKAYTTIKRRDGRRVVSVTADVTPPSQTGMVLEDMEQNILPQLNEKYQGLNYSFEGNEASLRESMDALSRGMILAMMVVYAMLAIPFKSYIQPSIIMASIPFGIVGAIIGHLIMGYSLSIMSMFGIVALSGVVVNDSLVLIALANRKVRDGESHYAAVVNAGIQRFRPIVLTTLTTFFGLMPMIFETSMQARFLIPMAISLGFGILFSTFIILLLVPTLYIIVEDIKLFLNRFMNLINPFN